MRLLAFALTVPAMLFAQTPSVRVSPNVLVSRNLDVGHAELHVAAHPRDANALVGMAITVRDIASKVLLESYATTDGGQTWTPAIPTHQLTIGGGDPIVGFTAQGAALGVALGGHGMWAYRSEDGGLTWDVGRRAGSGDHERLGVDYSAGPYAGRMYLASEVSDGRPAPDSLKRAVNLWRSQDDGRTWIGPTVITREPIFGIAVNALLVLSDGTVALFLNKYPNPGKDFTTPAWEIQLATSTDGGVTFSTPRAIGGQVFSGYGDLRRRQGEGRMDVAVGFDAAADTRGERFRDRIYMAYTETRSAKQGGRLVVRWSADKGRTWTAPKDIVAESRDAVSQFQPAVAVNKDGTVGVMWYDTRESNGREEFNVYFAASADGGESWSAPARITSTPSVPFVAGNVRPVALSSSQSATEARVSLISTYSRWPNGGDYMGLAADASGVFHPFWADARTGAYQVYTSRVDASMAAAPPALVATSLERRAVQDKVMLDLDPITVDWEHGELLIPVRLKNTSKDTVYGPLAVDVKSICARTCAAADSATVLNAANGSRGAGAHVDYAAALRDLPNLPPGAVTEAVLWRVKPASMRHTGLSIVATVSGAVRKP